MGFIKREKPPTLEDVHVHILKVPRARHAAGSTTKIMTKHATWLDSQFNLNLKPSMI